MSKPRTAAELLGLDSPLDRPLLVTFFPDQWAKSKTDAIITLRRFRERVLKTVATSKGKLPYVKLGRFGNEPTDHDCLRSNANMLTIDGVEGDYDRERMPPEEAARKLRRAGIAALIYETASSTPEKPRYRTFCPCSRSLPPENREALVARLNGILGGVLAGESFTLSQSFYYGGIASKPVPKTELVEGDYIDLRHDLDAGAMGKAGGREKHKDDDGGKLDRSNIAWELAMDLHYERETKQTFIRKISEDPILAAWAKKGEREVDRTWDRSKEEYDKEHERILSLFEYLGEPVKGSGPLGRMNEAHAVVRNGGETLIATFKKDKSVNFGSVADLHLFYKNMQLEMNGKLKAVSEHWIEWTKRRQYENGVVFDPSGKVDGKTLNLWGGWAVRADPHGSCKRFLNHLRHVVCNGDEDAFRYIVGWIADMVQNAGRKPGVGLVLKGDKGAGKSIVSDYLAKMIGPRHCPPIAATDHLTGKFNAHMEAALLLCVEEGYWAGNRAAEGVLKNLVTNERITIERKGVDPMALQSSLRIIITSNSDWIVPATFDERRWAVFDVSDSHIGDRAYFDAYAAEMEGDGPAALLAYLQSYDLTGFDVRTAPETEGLLEQKLASLRDFDRWWFEVLRRGDLADDWENGTIRVSCDDFMDDYNAHAKDDRFHAQHMDGRSIGKALRKLCPAVERKRDGKRSSRIWRYIIPDLHECRREFEKLAKRKIDWSGENA